MVRPAITAVLDGAESLTSARGPREVEVRTAESLGAQLHRVLREDADGLWFEWWFEELVAAAADRVREGNQPALWLLHGLTSIGTPVPASLAAEACSRLPGGDVPAWLGDLGRVAATGEAHLMRDVYGTRFAVLATFTYGDGGDPFVYLFDIDASGFVMLAGAVTSTTSTRPPRRGARLSATPPGTRGRNRSRMPASCSAWRTSTSATRWSWATSLAS